MVAFSTTAHPAASLEFLRFLTDRERDGWLLEMTRQVPLRAGLEESPSVRALLGREPVLEAFVRQAARLCPLDRTEHLVQVFDILSEAYEAASVFGVVPPARALSDAADRVDYLVENWR